jgi:thioesterase domain-containing protein/acyl carrier protein
MMTGMARVWRNVPGLPDIGPDDDFFRSGGHSLLAVRLIADIEEAFGVRLPVSAIFSAPTIRQMTSVVRNRGARGFPDLVTLNKGAGRPPLYCVHGVSGMVFEFSRFAQHAGNDQPVYGIQAPGLDGNEQPLERVEEMAERYIAILRRKQPRGPYCLLAYCAGSAIAYEMACRLEAAGAGPGVLGIIDHPAPCQEPGNLFWSLGRYLRNNTGGAALHAREFIHVSPETRRKSLRGLPRFILRKVRMLPDEVRKRQAPLSPGPAPPEGAAGPAAADTPAAGQGSPPAMGGYPEWIQNAPEPQKSVAMKNFDATGAYCPGKYQGKVILFMSREMARNCKIDGSSRQGYGWRKLTTGVVDIHIIEGDHESILLDGCIGQIGRIIRKEIDLAAAQGEGHER